MEASEVRGALEADWPELKAMLVEHDADPISGGLTYLEMSAVARFLADELRSGQTDRFPAFFDAVETCLLEGTHEAAELVTVGLLEDLQNGNITGLDDYSVWVPFLGPTSQRAWQAVEDFWNGIDPDALKWFTAR
jgi:hypothetical protein